DELLLYGCLLGGLGAFVGLEHVLLKDRTCSFSDWAYCNHAALSVEGNAGPSSDQVTFDRFTRVARSHQAALAKDDFERFAEPLLALIHREQVRVNVEHAVKSTVVHRPGHPLLHEIRRPGGQNVGMIG